ncbi:hypothetical protein GCM10025868_12470 [Angustibacter aerolatus]|uniref:Uncharacterized protein n=1 Tax=Angustibacter aerolatus TaxID=1162965 RepID=A0ABQ6JGF4_9ACTN|nr:hypothetical protein GCM10025868_12470 [Angustibacter aerolatus]
MSRDAVYRLDREQTRALAAALGVRPYRLLRELDSRPRRAEIADEHIAFWLRRYGVVAVPSVAVSYGGPA